MPRNGHLDRSHAEGQKGYFWTPKMEFPGFPDFGLCKGRADSQMFTAVFSDLGHRPVGPCLSRRVSLEHPAGVPGIFLLSLCALCFPDVLFRECCFGRETRGFANGVSPPV